MTFTISILKTLKTEIIFCIYNTKTTFTWVTMEGESEIVKMKSSLWGRDMD